MRIRGLLYRLGLTAGIVVVTASGGVAQSNEVFLLQESDAAAGLGNSLFIDQSEANDSRVGSDASVATQRGGNNIGTITLRGFGANVAFSQDGTGNVATVTGDTLARIVLDQQGDGNTGTVDVQGFGSSAELIQVGEDNVGLVRVLGNLNRGRLEQRGNGNEEGLEVTGFSLTPRSGNVSLVQEGNAVPSFNGLPAAVQVFTNSGGTVQITRTRQ